MKTAQPTALWRPELTFGMQGDDVYSWQLMLLEDGRFLGPTGADGDFRQLTSNATVAWQRARSVPIGELGTVGRWTLEAIGEHASPNTLRNLTWPHLPFIEATNWSREIPAQRKRNIVLHCIECAEASTAAENTAKWFAGRLGVAPRVSAHACVDDDSIVQCVPWERVAWHAPGANRLGIGIEHAGWARQTPQQWRDDYSRRMLQRSAWLVARLCAQFGLPVVFVTAEGLLRQELGITTHAEVNRAFHLSDHTDPGVAFPMDDYLLLVRSS